MKRVLALLLFVASLRADVVLPPIFSDRAVLQRSERVPVWGKAAPGEAVTVTLGEARAATSAGEDGRWRVELDLTKVPATALELVAQGRNRVVARDVLVGEVWLCAGQSNMEMKLSRAGGGQEEIGRPADGRLRQFLVKRNASPVPVEDAEGSWVNASPASSGSFSAVGYFFGRRLRDELQVSVGLINASVGGTYLEAWTSAEALDASPLHKPGKDRALKAYAERERYLTEQKAWVEKFGRQDRAAADADAFAAPETDVAGWRTITLPGDFAGQGLPEAGVVWIRRTVEISPAQAGKNLDVFLGDLRGANVVYWNGRKIAESDHFALERRYAVRAQFVRAGEAVLAVRVFNPGPGGGIAPGQVRFRYGNNQSLAGEWRATAEFALPPLSDATRAELPARPGSVPYNDQNTAGFLYNGMIRPLAGYGLRGFLWYQGEHNWNRGQQYRSGFPLLINDWRARWGRGELPFYFCQLPNYEEQAKKPGQSPWAEVREAQAAALALPATGMAVLIDVGDAGDIHPANKRDPGERLARIALADTYGRKDVVVAGPQYESMRAEGARVRVLFRAGAGGLVARDRTDAAIEGFAICGADRKWVWATAKIEGETVVVWSDEVPEPVAVRYAWAQNPVCNLVNEAGLPAAPFRTDDFPLTSEGVVY